MSLTDTGRPTGSSLGEAPVLDGAGAGAADDFDYTVFAVGPPAPEPTGGTLAVRNPALAAVLGQFHRAFDTHRPQSMFIVHAWPAASGGEHDEVGDGGEVVDPTGALAPAYEELTAQLREAARTAATASHLRWVLSGPQGRSIDVVLPSSAARAAAVRASLVTRGLDVRVGAVAGLAGTAPGEDALVDAAIVTVEKLQQQLGVRADDVLVAAGIKRRTFYSWKSAGRRPRVGSQARLWELAERINELEEQLGDTRVRAWLHADHKRTELLRAGEFDALLALVSDEQLDAHRKAGAETYARIDSPYGVGPEAGGHPTPLRTPDLRLHEHPVTEVKWPAGRGRDSAR